MKKIIFIISLIALSFLSNAQESKNVMFIHGAWSKGSVWENFENHFDSLGYNTYAPTLRFHSNKNDSLIGTSIFDYISDLKKLIKTMDSPPIVVAHSMGCIVGQKLAEANVIDKLILIGAPVNYGMMPPKDTINPVKWVTSIKDFKNQIIKPSFEHSKQVLFNSLDSIQQIVEYENLTYESGQVMKEMIWIKNIFGKKPNKIDYDNITIPTLLIYGGKDVAAPKGIADKLIKEFETKPELKVFENNAHWMMKEQNWKEIAVYINKWTE
jgi:pimeloyl-ACP methyl ester carboxylesterase